MIKVKLSKHLRIKNPADLFYLPVFVHVNNFHEVAAKEFNESFQRAHDLNQPIIPVMIDSYGGHVYSLLSMIDTVKNSSIKVATIVSGKAMSCGAALFSCGAAGHRFAGPNSTIMIHPVSSGSCGKVKDLKADIHEVERVNALIMKIMARNIDQPEDFFIEKMNSKQQTDWFMTAEEAKEIKLATHVKIPSFNIKCCVTMKLE